MPGSRGMLAAAMDPFGRHNASQSVKVLTSFSSFQKQKGVFKTDPLALQHCRHIYSTYLRLLFAVIQNFIPTRNRRDSYVRCSEKTFQESSVDSLSQQWVKAYLNKRPPPPVTATTTTTRHTFYTMSSSAQISNNMSDIGTLLPRKPLLQLLIQKPLLPH